MTRKILIFAALWPLVSCVNVSTSCDGLRVRGIGGTGDCLSSDVVL